TSSKVDVELDAQYRRRGLVEFPGYEAKLSGTYNFANPSSANAFIAFRIGLPVERSALMLSDLKLLVGGKEDPSHTEYAAEQIVWTGEVRGSETTVFTLEYRARGMQRFGYALAQEGRASPDQGPVRPVSNFEMAIRVKGVTGE